MSYWPRFVFPWMLLLLLLIPWSVWIGARIRSLGTFRKWTAITLRCVILACLVGALAGAELAKINDRLAVYFILDRSNSISEERAQAAEELIRQYCETYQTNKDDKAGVIVVGEQASIEIAPMQKMKLEKILSYVNGEQTDLAQAIRLAVAAFPQGYMRRIVLLTDGNETRGSVLEETKLAQAAGVTVDVVPIQIGGTRETRIKEISTPNQVAADEPFHIRVVANATDDCQGILRVYQKGRGERRLLRSDEVNLQAGDNSFLLTQELTKSGFYEYEVALETEADTIPENNSGRSFSVVQGEPVVLYVEGDPDNSAALGPALQAEGVDIERVGVEGLPASMAELQNYDAVILSNVSATELSYDHLQSLELMVRDLGIGLIMIGGDDTFGAGGYLNTPIEKALPVDMEVKDRKILPKGALVAILHTCEFQNGNAWALQIGLASLQVLSYQDMMGALGYLSGGDSWIYQLQTVGDKSRMTALLKKSAQMIGDMPSVNGTLQMAYTALANCDAAVKRIIIISDGDPGGPNPTLLSDLIKAKISVSTVCISPHSPNDQLMLSNLAKNTGGKYYYVTNPRTLPQIFSKEASVVKRGMMIEKEFTPAIKHASELVSSYLDEGFPNLHGYVITSPKDSATIALVSHEGDPVLAHWRYGLGKSIAFTPDVTTRWAPNWLPWEHFRQFWAQAVRWVVRQAPASNMRIETRVAEGQGRVRIDAVDEEGKFVNFLRPQAAYTVPGGGSEGNSNNVELVQTAPGIYEGAFPVEKSGAYMVNISYTDPEGRDVIVPTGLALGYSREYEYSSSNYPLLEKVAAAGVGRILTLNDNPFAHNLTVAPSISPIWHILAILAACLFPIEIFIRRVVLDMSGLWIAVAGLLRKLRPLRQWIAEPQRRAPVTGRYGSASPPPPESSVTHDYTDVAAEGEPSFGAVIRETRAETTQKAEAATSADGQGHSDLTSKLLAVKKRTDKQLRRGKDSSDEDKSSKNQ